MTVTEPGTVTGIVTLRVWFRGSLGFGHQVRQSLKVSETPVTPCSSRYKCPASQSGSEARAQSLGSDDTPDCGTYIESGNAILLEDFTLGVCSWLEQPKTHW